MSPRKKGHKRPTPKKSISAYACEVNTEKTAGIEKKKPPP
jgi:hypothetical protein